MGLCVGMEQLAEARKGRRMCRQPHVFEIPVVTILDPKTDRSEEPTISTFLCASPQLSHSQASTWILTLF